MPTRQPAAIETNFYPGSDNELAGCPHVVSIDCDGYVRRYGFYTLKELRGNLALDVRMGAISGVAAEAAYADVDQWINETDLAGTSTESPGGTRTQVPADVGHGSPPAGFIAWVMRWVLGDTSR